MNILCQMQQPLVTLYTRRRTVQIYVMMLFILSQLLDTYVHHIMHICGMRIS